MTLDAPTPQPASGGDDAARIERWAATRRADLIRLTLALRKAEAEASKAEARLAGDDGLGGGSPVDVLSVIDARLAKAAKDAEEGIEAARRDSTLVLSAVAQVASTRLEEAGLDRAEALRSTWRPPEPASGMRPPRSAEDLWQAVMATVPADGPTAGSTPETPPALQRESPVPPSRARTDVAATDAVTTDVVAIGADSSDEHGSDNGGSDGSGGDAARVYDLFWGRVPSERPVRERLRRRTERGAQ